MNLKARKKLLLVKHGSYIFKGQKITNDNLVGTAWLQQLVTSDSTNSTQVGNVTFEPGARTKWHLHPGGQFCWPPAASETK